MIESKQLTIAAVIPAYNSSHFIHENLNAVARQRRTPDEIVLVDDGSTDDTVAVAKEWMRVHPFNARVIRQSNQGPSAARNTGILAATADLIAPIDADDVVLENHLQVLESGFLERSELGLCFADGESFEDQVTLRESFLEGSEISKLPIETTKSGCRIITGSAYCGIVGGSRIPTCATLYRRRMALEAGLYDTSFSRCNDREFFLRMSRRGVFGYFPVVVARIRRHSSNLTHMTHHALHLEQQIRALMKMLHSSKSHELSDNEISATHAAMRRAQEELCYAKASDGLVEFLRYLNKYVRLGNLPSARALTRNLARSIYFSIGS